MPAPARCCRAQCHPTRHLRACMCPSSAAQLCLPGRPHTQPHVTNTHTHTHARAHTRVAPNHLNTRLHNCRRPTPHVAGGATVMNVLPWQRTICADIVKAYGKAPNKNRKKYNTIQCGHPPYNEHGMRDGPCASVPPRRHRQALAVAWRARANVPGVPSFRFRWQRRQRICVRAVEARFSLPLSF